VTRQPTTRTVRLCIAALAIAAAAACAKHAPQTQPASGRVTVGVTSRGPGVASMTFTVSIEPAGVNAPIKADAGVYTANDTPAGTHTVRLRNVPGSCRIEGSEEREITVAARSSAVVRFVVVCS
jgi:type 1 fimbria pilin